MNMKKALPLTFFLLLIFHLARPQTGFMWKAGLSKAIITPEKPMWMAGYASRTSPSKGKYQELWAKALILEDTQGSMVLLLTADILGFPKKMSDRIRNQLHQKYGLEKSQIILNGSHTHSGPVLENALYDIYPLDGEQLALIKSYSAWLEKKVLELAGEAIDNKQAARLSSANGVTRFQVNRRNNSEQHLIYQTGLTGPNDYAVPVIKIEDEAGKLTGIVFGYACHPTVLNHDSWSGDYPGYAQEELEKIYPGVTAMFFQGASGDQNPLPRRTLPLAKQYGKSLAAAVERVLEEDMSPLSSDIRSAYVEIDLPLSPAPETSSLTRMVNEESGYIKRWAERMLTEGTQGKSPISTYPYPLQIWRLGQQTIFNMGGEVTVAYANALKGRYGQDAFVMAYSNDVMGYIPSEIILEEGGYEGYSSQMVYGLPSPWEKGIESRILEAFDALATKLEIKSLIPAQD